MTQILRVDINCITTSITEDLFTFDAINRLFFFAVIVVVVAACVVVDVVLLAFLLFVPTCNRFHTSIHT